MVNITEHTCDVVRVKLEPHTNADSLSIVRVGDYQCLVRTADWNDGDLGVYIPPDSIVPERPEFAFLGDHRRIKVKKLRGEWSMGLLIPAPEGVDVGDDCMEMLGIVHYEPEVHGNFQMGGENVKAPDVLAPCYGVLNFRKYPGFFTQDEKVIVTEKLHGCNSRYVCVNDQMFAGSHKHWKQQSEKNLWWKALGDNPSIEAWCRHHQDMVLYGEVYGQVQNLKYGVRDGSVHFALFDVMRGGQWLDFDAAKEIAHGVPWVPLVYRGAFDKDKILALAEGDSSVLGADHHREGVVIVPVKERINHKIGRVKLKIVGNRYLSNS